jgi:hypothetical protein
VVDKSHQLIYQSLCVVNQLHNPKTETEYKMNAITTTPVTQTPAQERIETRNRRFKYAKERADKVNTLFNQFSKIVGSDLSADQIRNLLSLASDFELANDSAERSYRLYSDFCDRHDYKMRDINYLYPYNN